MIIIIILLFHYTSDDTLRKQLVSVMEFNSVFSLPTGSPTWGCDERHKSLFLQLIPLLRYEHRPRVWDVWFEVGRNVLLHSSSSPENNSSLHPPHSQRWCSASSEGFRSKRCAWLSLERQSSWSKGIVSYNTLTEDSPAKVVGLHWCGPHGDNYWSNRMDETLLYSKLTHSISLTEKTLTLQSP